MIMLDALSRVPVGSAAYRGDAQEGAGTMPVRRQMPGGELQAAHLYLTSRQAGSEARRAMGDKKHGPYRTIAAHCRAHGDQDEKGSYTWLFDAPVIIGGHSFVGFRLQASQPAPYFDDEAAQELITSLGPGAVAAATHTETVWDLDQLFLFLQQGLISAEDINRVLITPAKDYALTVLQGE